MKSQNHNNSMWREQQLLSDGELVNKCPQEGGYRMVILFSALAMLSFLSVWKTYQSGISFMLGGAALGFALYVVYIFPHMGVIFCMFLFEVPAHASEVSGPLFHINGMGCALLFIVCFFFHFWEKGKSLYIGFWEPGVLCGLLFIVSIVYIEKTIVDEAAVVCAALAIIGIGTIRSKDQIRDVVVVMWLAGTIIAVIGLIHGVSETGVGSSEKFTFEQKDPNYWGLVVGFAAICGIGAIVERRINFPWWLIMLMLCSIIPITMALGLQASRSALVGVTAATVASAVVSIKGSNFRRQIPIVITLVVMAWIVFLTPFGEVWVSRFSDNTLGTGSDRTILWSASLEAYTKMPLLCQIFGRGYGGSLFAIGEAANLPLASAHNMFLALLIDSGLLGVLIMFIFIARILHRIFACDCLAPRLSFVFLVYWLTQSLFLETQRQVSFWCGICIVVAGVLPRSSKTGLRSPHGSEDFSLKTERNLVVTPRVATLAQDS